MANFFYPAEPTNEASVGIGGLFVYKWRKIIQL